MTHNPEGPANRLKSDRKSQTKDSNSIPNPTREPANPRPAAANWWQRLMHFFGVRG
ncbi:MAG: hypothetical protein ACYTG5_20420 [Planctomycetota bacterium]|jgi:hypothetical protein